MDVTTAISPSEAGTILTVDLEAIVANWQTLRMVCGDAECGAVVKADAYGLGPAPVPKAVSEVGCGVWVRGSRRAGSAAAGRRGPPPAAGCRRPAFRLETGLNQLGLKPYDL